MNSGELLLRPVGPQTKRRINNFGIELEALESGTYQRTVDSYVRPFVSAGLADSTDKHGYHCYCSTCLPARSAPHFAVQSDCSVGVELVSRILHADVDHEIVVSACEAHEAGMTAARWRPDGSNGNGNHIHVSHSGEDAGTRGFRAPTQAAANGLIESLFAMGASWDMAAAGGCRRLRNYNGPKPTKTDRNERYNERTGHYGRSNSPLKTLEYGRTSSWLSDRGYGTNEFRLWNTPSKASRIQAHAGLSIAIMRWAFTQVIFDRAVLAELDGAEACAKLTVRLDDLKEVLLDACPSPFREASADALEQLQPT